jgi:hypothetical protein
MAHRVVAAKLKRRKPVRDSAAKRRPVSARAKAIEESKAARESAIADALAQAGLSGVAAREVATGIAAEVEFDSAPMAQEMGGLVAPKPLRWAIRHDDLQLLTHLTDGIKAAGPAGMFFWAAQFGIAPVGVLAGAVGVVVAGFRLFRQIYRRGIRLTESQRMVVCALKRIKKANVERLTDDLNWHGLEVKEERFTTEEIAGLLSSLREVRTSDGEVIAIVNSDSSGVWSVRGI